MEFLEDTLSFIGVLTVISILITQIKEKQQKQKDQEDESLIVQSNMHQIKKIKEQIESLEEDNLFLNNRLEKLINNVSIYM